MNLIIEESLNLSKQTCIITRRYNGGDFKITETYKVPVVQYDIDRIREEGYSSPEEYFTDGLDEWLNDDFLVSREVTHSLALEPHDHIEVVTED